MIVTCQNCEAHFSLNDGLVKKTGSKVRCSKCKHIFVIYPEEPPELEMLSTDAGSESSLVSQEPRGGGVSPPPPGGPSLGGTLDGEAAAGGDLDLSEIEKMLSTDGLGETDDWDVDGKSDIEGAKENPPEVQLSATSSGALDLAEIEKIFETDQDTDDTDKMLEPEPEDLVFDLEESAVHTNEPQKELGDFDIADIEKMLEEEMVGSETDKTGDLLSPPNAPLSPASSADEKAEDEVEPFSFADIDEMMETDAAIWADSNTGDEKDELTLEMDDDFKPAVTASLSQPAAEIEELDFSDLEGMIKADTTSRPAGDAVGDNAEEELVFALDSDDRFEMLSAESKLSDSSKATDLSRLDELLEGKTPEPSDEVSLELDLADTAPISSAATDADDLELHFDGIGSEDHAIADTSDETDVGQPMKTQDLALSFDDQAMGEASSVTEDVISSAEEAQEEEAEAVTSDTVSAMAKRSRKPLVLVLALVLLVGAALCGYLFFGDRAIEFLNRKGIPIPFSTMLKKPAITDAGNLKITTIDIDSRFVENSVAGRVFVVSGKARNGYADSRSRVQITGKLYSKGKQLVNAETVYCGNMMTGPELSSMSGDNMRNRLQNRQGDNGANVTIKPGEDCPFMVVFLNLPENLEEFTLEVVGSESAAQLPQK